MSCRGIAFWWKGEKVEKRLEGEEGEEREEGVRKVRRVERKEGEGEGKDEVFENWKEYWGDRSSI